MKSYYVSGNTSEGFVDFLPTNIEGMQIIRLDDITYHEASEIFRELLAANKADTPIEVLKSPISERFLEGLIFREKGLAVLGNREQPFTDKAYLLFQKGLAVHDDLEQVYVNEMDFKKADERAEELIQELFQHVPEQKESSIIYRRLFGTNTVDGVVNEVPELTRELERVYHIKGRSGTGKSTFMKKVAKQAETLGLDLELYHCSFDPGSIDMVLIPALRLCLLDSTDPHAFTPENTEKEKVIDLYEIAVTPGTDEKYADEIAALTKEYKSYMKKGVTVIKEEGNKIIEADQNKPVSKKKIKETIAAIQGKIDG